MKKTIRNLLEKKNRREKIVALTAYDFSFAKILDAADVDIVLVGDSLGMVMQGKENTIPVTIEEMIYHAACVSRGLDNSLLMVDMPFMSYRSPEQALENAGRLMKEGGAHMVKLEGGAAQSDIVKRLADFGVPVCGHLGLQPQFVHKLSGYRVQGRENEVARKLASDARVLESAGADMLILECVPASLAAEITKALHIPVIGIGAGVDCDGQVLVLQDVLGITPDKAPKFSENFMQGHANIADAIAAYVAAVRQQTFPSDKHTFS